MSSHFSGLQATPKAADSVKELRQQLNRQEQELQDARAEVLQLRCHPLQKSKVSSPTAVCDATVQTAVATQVGRPDVLQQAYHGDLQAQIHSLNAELRSANLRCTGSEAKLLTAKAQYQAQQKRIAALEDIVYDLRLQLR